MKELTLSDLDKLDIIEITVEESEKITNWCLKNQDKITLHRDNIKYIFSEGIIKRYTGSLWFIQYYKVQRERLMFNCYAYNKSNNDFRYLYSLKEPVIKLKDGIEFFLDGIEPESLLPKIIDSFEYNSDYEDFLIKMIKKEDIPQRFINTTVECIQMFFSILIYCQLNQEQVITQTRTHTKKIQSKKDKRKGKKPRIRLIKQNIIKLNTNHIPEPTEEERRHYERHTFGWTVRGHWREYQSGKKVWIKPQIRGDKSRVEGKIYEI
ncbi:hypothetical protein [Clostridium botulinum]|uniref:hypothetical protein n=1 Tax=Clostridium botulinum TaxID=1491 RepID=UPI0009579911|nr:hypothetical protein [Clostridium botulinum]APU60762.1 hypothetical protein NPD8_2721 [Clostridium botulinum]